MARTPRHQLAPSALRPGTLYHVSNRGAGRRDLFASPADRLVFLAALADACLRFGLRIHAFCLMSNHFHLLAEDPRGCLPQALSLAQSVYARYFNDARGERGAGHLFGDRYFCDVVTSPAHYLRLAAYILLNPVRCQIPLAASPERYAWSSAPLHCSPACAGEYFAGLVDRYGGLEALLEAMPAASTRQVEANRRRRLEALVSGAWMSADAARMGRSAEQMRAELGRQAAPGRAGGEEAAGPGETGTEAAGRAPGTDGVPRVAAAHVGLGVEEALEEVREASEAMIEGDGAGRAEVMCHLLWRVSSGSADAIGQLVGWSGEAVERAIEAVRTLRRTERAWAAALWRAEWHLRWRLAAGPWREC